MYSNLQKTFAKIVGYVSGLVKMGGHYLSYLFRSINLGVKVYGLRKLTYTFR